MVVGHADEGFSYLDYQDGGLRLSVGSTVLMAWVLGLNEEERDLAAFLPSALDDGYSLSSPLKSCRGDFPVGMDLNQGM